MQGNIAYNKKRIRLIARIRRNPFIWVHLKSTVVEIRCFYYLNSKVITTKNNSKIIMNREVSLFVIINHRLSIFYNTERENI